MGVTHTTLFKNNQTQAVRLPKSVALDDDVKEVVIIALGKSRVISPAAQAWDDWFEASGVSSDFMNERDQEPDQHREAL